MNNSNLACIFEIHSLHLSFMCCGHVLLQV